MTKRPETGAALIAALAAAVLTAATAAGAGLQADPDRRAAQLETESVAAEELPVGVDAAEAPPPEDQLAEPRLRLEEAEALFNSARQPESVPLLTALIESLAAAAEAELAELLVRARVLRAEAEFNLGDSEAALRDLSALLMLDPGFTLDSDAVSPKFYALLEQRRAEMVGELVAAISPADATITLGDRTLGAWQGAAPVLAGPYRVRVERPGYHTLEADVVVPPADRAVLEAHLERASAVVRLSVRPAEVEVVVDGALAATTAQDGQPLFLDGLQIGSHELELRKPGFRTRRVQVELDALADYDLEPLALEPARGTLRLTPPPEGATARIDGEVPASEGLVAGIGVVPGEHLVEVDLPLVGSFARTVEVADREEVSVVVELRPIVALLGVGAGQGDLAARVREELDTALGALDSWSYLERTSEGTAIFAELGTAIAELPAIASGEVAVSWRDLQQAFDREIAASLYLAATTGGADDAPRTEVWLWSPAPAPPAPTRWTTGEGESQTADAVLDALKRPLSLTTLRLGARLVDSAAAGGPVVASLSPDGPAAAAGLEIGDLLTQVGDRPVTSRSAAIALLQTRPPTGTIEIGLRRGEEPRRLTLLWQQSPRMRWPGQTGPDAPIGRAQIRLALAGGSGAPVWLLQLDEASRLLGMRQWLQAADLLRTIEAPERAGLGRGAVDYWLGVALAAGDPTSEAAQRAFERAAGAVGATLHDDDGPLVAPRAIARLGRSP